MDNIIIILIEEKTLFTNCTSYLNGVIEFWSIFRNLYFLNNLINNPELKQIFNVLTMTILYMDTERVPLGECLAANPTRILRPVVDFSVSVQITLINVHFSTNRAVKHFWKNLTRLQFLKYEVYTSSTDTGNSLIRNHVRWWQVSLNIRKYYM